MSDRSSFWVSRRVLIAPKRFCERMYMSVMYVQVYADICECFYMYVDVYGPESTSTHVNLQECTSMHMSVYAHV